jgi:hypothetical protein
MKNHKIPSFPCVFIALCTILVAAGCSDSDPVSPGIQPEIINGTQSFEFQVSAVQNYTGSVSYTWNNSSTFASVDQSSAVTSGSATLTIKDAAGEIVYSRSLAEDGSLPTPAGTAGDWVLTISLESVSGDLNFRVDEGT